MQIDAGKYKKGAQQVHRVESNYFRLPFFTSINIGVDPQDSTYHQYASRAAIRVEKGFDFRVHHIKELDEIVSPREFFIRLSRLYEARDFEF